MRISPDFAHKTVALIAAISCLVVPAFGQSVATDPVGFVTVNVAAGSAASPTLSLVSPTLMQPVEWQGAIATISGTTITVAGTPWTNGQFGTNGQYFIEVASGASAGAWTDIQSSTTNGLTTLDSLSAFAAQNTTIRIRKHTKLTDFVGVNNSAGLKGAASLAAADEVLVYDGANSTTYWYYDASDAQGPAGWYDSGYQPATNVVIAPHEGVVVRRKGTTPVGFVAMGSVKTGNTFFPIKAGINVLGTVSAKGLTLATSGLYTGNATTGVKGASALAAADEITIFSGGGSTVYWYYDASDAQGPAGWYDSAYASAGAVPIVAGSAIVVNRKAPGAAFNWPMPSPTSF